MSAALKMTGAFTKKAAFRVAFYTYNVTGESECDNSIIIRKHILANSASTYSGRETLSDGTAAGLGL